MMALVGMLRGILRGRYPKRPAAPLGAPAGSSAAREGGLPGAPPNRLRETTPPPAATRAPGGRASPPRSRPHVAGAAQPTARPRGRELAVIEHERAVHEHVAHAHRRLMLLFERGAVGDRIGIEHGDVGEEPGL